MRATSKITAIGFLCTQTIKIRAQCAHFFFSAVLCVSALSAFRSLTSKLNAEFAEAQRAAEYLFSPYR